MDGSLGDPSVNIYKHNNGDLNQLVKLGWSDARYPSLYACAVINRLHQPFHIRRAAAEAEAEASAAAARGP